MEIKAGHYYLTNTNHLVYIIDKSKLGGTYIAKYLWDIKCLTTGKPHRLDEEYLSQTLSKNLGTSIAPAIRLLYSGFNTHI